MEQSRGKIAGRGILKDVLLRHVVPDLNRLSGASAFTNSELANSKMMDRTKFRFLPSDVAASVHLLVDGRQAELVRICDDMLAQGCSMRDLYLVLFTDCARKLGDMWCLDQCSFGDVTIGLVNLHVLMRTYRDRLDLEIAKSETPRSVLIATMPGDTHILGASMLECFFTAASWRCQMALDETVDSLKSRIRDADVGLVCLSVSCSSDLEVCKLIIEHIRGRDSEKAVKIMVGGKVFLDKPSLVGNIGADAMARDAREALDVAAGIGKQTHEVCALGVVS